MISEYKRPATIDEARKLHKDGWKALGGGSYISTHQDDFSKVFDTQSLGLDYIREDNGMIQIGAATKLQKLVEADLLPDGFIRVLKQEKNLNIRNAASIFGILLTSDGRSDILAWFLCADAIIKHADGTVALQELIAQKADVFAEEIIINKSIKIAHEKVSRTPDDFSLAGVYLRLDEAKDSRTIVINGITENAPIKSKNNFEKDINKQLDEMLINARSQLSTKWSSLIYQKTTISNLIKRLNNQIVE